MIRASQSLRCGLPSEATRAGSGPRSRSLFLPRARAALIPFLALALWPAAVRAQGTPQDSARLASDTGRFTFTHSDAPRGSRRPSDFLFSRPRASVAIRAGAMFPRAGSDIFSFSENELTLKRSDLTAPSVAFDFQYSLLPQADVLFTAGWSHKAKQTELRHWDDNGAPIRQTTAMTEFPLTAGLKWYLVPRGRQIGHFAWVPTRAVPYVGIAGGAQHHSFKQSGLFVDAADSTIFNATYESSGWSGTVHLLGGVDVAVSRQAALRIEARYAWGSAGMGSDFENFSNLDLAGLQTTVGLSWRY